MRQPMGIRARGVTAVLKAVRALSSRPQASFSSRRRPLLRIGSLLLAPLFAQFPAFLLAETLELVLVERRIDPVRL